LSIFLNENSNDTYHALQLHIHEHTHLSVSLVIMKCITLLSLLALAFTATAVPVQDPVLDFSDIDFSNLPIPADGGVENIFSPCSGGGATMKIDSLLITPDPPRVGQDLNFSIAGSLSRALENGARLSVKAYFGIIKVKDEDLDLCSSLNLKCPYATGKQSIAARFVLPSGIPAGIGLKVELRARNKDNSELFCLSGTLKLKK